MPRTSDAAWTEKLHTRMACDRVRAALLWMSPLLAALFLAGAQDSRQHLALSRSAAFAWTTSPPNPLQGKKGIRVSMSQTAQQELASKTRGSRKNWP